MLKKFGSFWQNYSREAGYDMLPTMADGKNRGVKLKATYAIIGVLCFGVLLVALNIYQLYNLPVDFVPVKGSSKKKIAWIFSKEIYHLNHVMTIFDKVGYKTIHSMSPPINWDVMWSFDYPFKKEFVSMLKNLESHQKVNHLPGSGFITLKVELATSKLRWIPKAFSIPKEQQALATEAKLNPKNLWVQKSNDHRGIKIVSIDGLDYSAEGSFVQLYVSNPLLIDGRKFDIGIYTVVTSVDPLRVYIYEEEMLVRFCQTDYEPLDVNDVTKYVVGADYDAPSQMPSLQSFFNHGHYSRKQALFGYLKNRGKDTKQLWKDIRQAVREAFIAKEVDMANTFSGYKSQHNFFELVRFDFVIDADMNIWLMEVNMSPNLSSSAHYENRLMYEQVIYHAFGLTGVASLAQETSSEDIKEVMVNDRDIMVNSAKCRRAVCLSSCEAECALCIQCVSDDMKMHFKNSFLEQTYKGNYRRVLPIPKEEKSQMSKQELIPVGRNNKLLEKWYEIRCSNDAAWCQ
eukprot:Seg2921.3 transcript_id=Seg2921.3/GoldUCD/mRNA.D3Y31 product="Tubulin polyglutamylase TTLL5" protein_id=Seg2921.3/GoldUCD/D3Y31